MFDFGSLAPDEQFDENYNGAIALYIRGKSTGTSAKVRRYCMRFFNFMPGGQDNILLDGQIVGPNQLLC
jgi:hypothetical protein